MVDGCKVSEIKMNGCFVFVVGLVIQGLCGKQVAGRELDVKVLYSSESPRPCSVWRGRKILYTAAHNHRHSYKSCGYYHG